MKKTKLLIFTLIAFLVLGFAVNVNALEITESLTLTDDVNEEIVIPEGKNVTLNLGGKTITAPNGKVAITNNGTLTIEGEGNVIADGNYAVLNHGAKLTIEGGSYSKVDPAKTQSLISNGWYTNSDNTSGSISEMIINGGTFDGGSYTAIKNDSYGKMTINGGSIISTQSSAGVQDVGNELTINGGTFDAVIWVQNYTSQNGQEKTIIINGGTFNKAVTIKPDNKAGEKASIGHVSIGSEPVFNHNLAIQNTYSPAGTNTFVIEKFKVKNIGGGLYLGGTSDVKMPAVNLDGMTIGGQLNLSYVENSIVKNTNIKSDIMAGDITLDNVTAKSLVSNAKNVTQNIKNSNIIWVKESTSHPVTVNITDSNLGKIAPSSNGNTTMYIDNINLDGVVIKADSSNSLATGEFIVNGGNATIKNSSIEKITIPEKSKTDLTITVEDKSDIGTIANNRTDGNTAQTIINLPEDYAIDPSGTVTKPIKDASVAAIKGLTYTGKKLTPNTEITFGKTKLIKGTDYTVSYKNNINAGTATVVITGKGTYTGTVEKTFKINPMTISASNTKITGIYNKVYNKHNQYQKNIVVKLSGKTLKNGTDYKISYKNNKNIGKATLTITGKGNYKGTITRTFKIEPVKIAIKKFKKSGNSFRVYYYAPAGGVKYQVAYKQKNNKTWKYVKTSKTNVVARYLKKNMKYYVKVRAYKVVNGQTYYGAWSNTKTVKIKR